MDALPFRHPGRFFRGNLHTHTTASDGTLSPAEAVAAYRRDGYDFLAITDHFMERYGYRVTDSRGLRTSDFATLLGAELHAPALANGEPWHLVAVGLPPDFAPPAAAEDGPELAARAAAAGAFVGLAHPAWYGLDLADARAVDAAHAVEVYNETCAMLSDRGESWAFADALLAEGRRLGAFGADDAHFEPGRPDAFGCWVWVRAERLEPEALLDALKAGRYYTSQGPRIHDIAVDGDAAECAVACSPAASVFVSGRGWPAAAVHGRGITACRLPFAPFRGSFCRVTVVDAAGKRAWSNPIWLD